MDKNKISLYRAKVIENTITIESLINIAITINYFGYIKPDFLLEVLYDEYFNSGLKIKILKKSFPDKIDNTIENKIRRLIQIRNLFAHNHNLKIYNGEKWVVVNPKDYISGYEKTKVKGIDFQKLFNEFNILNRKVKSILETIVKEKIKT